MYSCTTSPPTCTGYVVYKEYTPAHYGTNNRKIYYEAGFIVPTATTASTMSSARRARERRESKYFPSKWVLYVANQYDVHQFSVDSLLYVTNKCGDKITLHIQ